MALQPSAADKIDHTTTPPFLLRLFYRSSRPLDPHEFSIAPPPEATASTEYFSILPPAIQQNCLELYQWPDCTLAQLTRTLMAELGSEVEVGCRVVYKLIFPDTRAQVSEGGRGKWIDKPLGSVVVGGREAELESNETFEGDALKTLADARFVIGDYVACAIYSPGPDGRVPPMPAGRPMREGFGGGRGGRDNGFGRGGWGGGDGFRGGYGGRGGMGGAAPPVEDWRRGDRPPGGGFNGGGGYSGGYRGGRGRPY